MSGIPHISLPSDHKPIYPWAGEIGCEFAYEPKPGVGTFIACQLNEKWNETIEDDYCQGIIRTFTLQSKSIKTISS